jgi:flagellin-like protein
MQLKQLFTDDEAVSPVIGVILMVAITVILAAVIGTFVLGLGSNQQANPTAGVDIDTSGSGDPEVTLVSLGGGADFVECRDDSGSSTGTINSVGGSITCQSGYSLVAVNDDPSPPTESVVQTVP